MKNDANKQYHSLKLSRPKDYTTQVYFYIGTVVRGYRNLGVLHGIYFIFSQSNIFLFTYPPPKLQKPLIKLDLGKHFTLYLFSLYPGLH